MGYQLQSSSLLRAAMVFIYDIFMHAHFAHEGGSRAKMNHSQRGTVAEWFVLNLSVESACPPFVTMWASCFLPLGKPQVNCFLLTEFNSCLLLTIVLSFAISYILLKIFRNWKAESPLKLKVIVWKIKFSIMHMTDCMNLYNDFK